MKTPKQDTNLLIMVPLQLILVLISSWCFSITAFHIPAHKIHQRWHHPLQRQHQPLNPFVAKTNTVIRSVSDVEAYDTEPQSSGTSMIDELEGIKSNLATLCMGSSKPSLQAIEDKVRRLEEVAEQVGIGQASSTSGLLNGEWELLYSPEDVTRSSPFFWAFRRAFPDSADQIFSITDNIPPPIKETGPAYQTINTSSDNLNLSSSSSLVSRVTVATLGGIATSVMTTRCTVLNTEGLEGLRLRVDSTKPERSTVLETLGPLGKILGEKSAPFPSGEALEAAQPGSSEVVMVTTFCDEGLRISRNADAFGGIFVWKRKSFGDGDGSDV